ncbi:HNH endonuclease signature motif containing protein [Streptomyces sp. NPDC060198]|uniref:HNH endonuclease signature motif containing protein n=1 Tax=Streptomyces sp. NPDC060198 TaxID=3347070 RepID=UPI003654177A
MLTLSIRSGAHCQWQRIASPTTSAMGYLMTLLDSSVQRGKRTKQPTWVWLMVLTAHAGACTYCAVNRATTLDHEAPIGDNGADVWWNLLPACKPCNDWKGKRTASGWLIDQKLHRKQPAVGFDTRRMPLRMFHGFEERIGRTLRELREVGRRDWFRHHYGHARHGNKAEMQATLSVCRKSWIATPIYPGEPPMCTKRPSISARGTCAVATGIHRPAL